MKFKDYLKEKKTTYIKLIFKSYGDLYKAYGILSEKGYSRPEVYNKDDKYVTLDDYKYSLSFKSEFLKDIEKILKGKLKYQVKQHKPIGYKVFDHGGYLD